MFAFRLASCGMIYIQIFKKFDSGVQVILTICLRKLRGCNVGIIEGSDS
jgi:hypothetical protein